MGKPKAIKMKSAAAAVQAAKADAVKVKTVRLSPTQPITPAVLKAVKSTKK